MKLIGICLIVFGVLALALGGFNYTTRERVVDLGPLKVDADKNHSVPIAPIAGVAALVGGIALVMVGAKIAGLTIGRNRGDRKDRREHVCFASPRSRRFLLLTASGRRLRRPSSS